jgi:hypothetical protein
MKKNKKKEKILELRKLFKKVLVLILKKN